MKLKSYVYFVERPDGCLVRGADRSFVVQGAGAYAKVAKLLGYCDGRFSRDQIRSAVAVEAQPWFDSLVAELETNRFLLPVEPGATPAPDADRFADTIAYLSDWHDAPHAALTAWRGTRVALLGDGDAAAIATHALNELGVGAISDRSHEAALTIILCDRLDAAAVDEMLSNTGIGRDAPVLAAGGMRGAALVLPVLPGAASVAAALDRVRLPDLGVETVSETALTIAAGLVAIEALHHVVGQPVPSATSAHRLFHVSAHGFVDSHVMPSGYFGDADPPDPTAWASSDDPAHDSIGGLFAVDHAETDRQMPLHLFGLRARLPHSAGGGEPVALGWGLTEQDAAYRAHLAGVAAYAAPVSDTARLAVCRDAARVVAAGAAWAMPTGPLRPLADIATPGGQAAMLGRLLHIYGVGDIHAAAAKAGSWAVAEVATGDASHRCVGETAEAALAEILGALVAACQSAGDIGQVDVPPLAARVPDETVQATRATESGWADPVLGRLGWHIAELAR